ncbi:hypothetical protein C9980_08295 [Vibrio mediterranei]|uniref:Lipoprotein n=1 Tax=Vibrio mediterranei TaxID=689 RepID=A0ABX5D5A8_9VIBR|nr:DUF6279 family lipoprotein [Vibrio mediterranei]MCG9662649.1 DUF6279 family lipoprotein [Vibrio mediterranei]PCD86095.1 hypothetical protein COR52_23575 [Vibrio mediterranei]PRQ64858.1 hypothetical protein COR51_25365 [Vibrio mediterranei]PTC05236.1 hypothetical protein C9980_08295 [Vibrio mediterranei]
MKKVGWVKSFGLFVSLLIVTGCTTKFLYSNLDWFIVDYIDDYVTLEDGQEEILTERILVLGDWHKSNELPRYLQQLTDIRNKDPKTVDAEYVSLQMEQVRQHTKRLVAQITPDLYALTQQMTDKQVKELLENLEQKDDKFIKKYQGLQDEDVRLIYQQRIEENLERWFGPLTEQQKTLASRWANEMDVTVFDWQAHRQQMQHFMRQLLNRRSDLGYFQPEFQRLLNDSESFYSEKLKLKIANNRLVAEKYIALALNSVTEKQHQHLIEEIDGWRDIASDLMTSALLDYSSTEKYAFPS